MAYTFTYDPYGNLTGEPDAAGAVTTYGLDLADRLTSFDPPSTGATTFGYDALARIVTRVRPDGTDTYRFTGTSEQVAGISINVGGTGTAIASLVEPAGGRPLTKSGSTTYAALPDVTGSTAAVAVNSTAVAGAVRFDAWGMPVAETATSVGPFRYRGALELAPAGADPLYESGARLYRPGLAAFTSLDTYAGAALEPASLNRYLYAEANPATLVDPSGHVAVNNLCLYDAADCGAVAAAGQTVRRQEGYSQSGVVKARGAEIAEAVATGDRYISDVGTDRWADADTIAAVTEAARLARCAGDPRCLAEGGWSGGAGPFEVDPFGAFAGAVAAFAVGVGIVAAAAACTATVVCAVAGAGLAFAGVVGTAQAIDRHVIHGEPMSAFDRSFMVTGLVMGGASVADLAWTGVRGGMRGLNVAGPARGPYVRPAGATTAAQRAAVQGQPCVECGSVTPVQRADHITPLVRLWYEGGDFNIARIRAVEAVQAHCPTCSNRQGGMLSWYSREMRRPGGR